MTAGRSARRLTVEGVVQGVGFRPHVWRLAERHALGGWVRNRDGVVEIVVEGDESGLDRFCAELARRPPPLARIDRICSAPTPPQDRRAFTVDGSAVDGHAVDGHAVDGHAVDGHAVDGHAVDGHAVDGTTADGTTADGTTADGRPANGQRIRPAAGRRLVAPDAATCDACRRELADPADRRHGYPFVNCTDCGPRFTIIDDLPYDRSRTSMASFPLCAACAREYEDPTDRRFHAEPVACPDCGPRVRLVDRGGCPLGPDAIGGAAERLRSGGIVALKGLGGYQLACDATDEDAVAGLRRRKRRPHKPLAVMVADLAAAHGIAHLDEADVALLTSVAAPIVLVRARTPDRGGLAPSIAPGHHRVGLLLPTTPLHHLLLAAAGRPLVMTSGNRTDEPIAVDDGDARRRLAEVADAFLVHDRRIACRYDDSVARVRRDGPALLRRARGYAPAPVGLPVDVVPTIAVGAELQAAFCLASGRDAFLSPHIGDLDSDDAVAAFEQSLAHHRRLLRIEPQVVAHDLHPDLASTRIAEALGLSRVAVQHHHAHVAAVMAEHGLRDPVLGVAFDGFGLGADGSGWGGELLVCDWAGAERVGHLRVVRQPGGDAAVRRPARMAVAHAQDAGRLDDALTLLGLAPDQADDRLTGATARLLTDQVDAGFLAPPTSSAGRLFDAVAALTGICTEPTYEGQPAVLVEQAAIAADPAAAAASAYRVVLGESDGRLVIDTRPLVGSVIDDLLAGSGAATVARRFHDWLAAAVVEACRALAAQHGLGRVCLAGGVFANDVLVDAVRAGLDCTPLRAYAARAVPPGDGGLALGQILVAHAHGGG